MQIDLIVIGKTDSTHVESLVAEYLKRLNLHIKVNLIAIPDLKNRNSLPQETQKQKEGVLMMNQLSDGDFVVLLDEHGKEMRSVDFSTWIQKRMNSGIKRLCFLIGGPYGFSSEVRARANDKISLSQMTFSHQIIRAIFAEQLYRAFTILRNEPYHHE